MTHKEMTAHIRNRLKVMGVNARVKMNDFNGHRIVTVVVPVYEYRWTQEERDAILLVASVNGLTFIRGMELSPILVNEMQVNFEFRG